MTDNTTQAGAESYPPDCSLEEYRNNILEGVALWLNGRSRTVWATEFGHTGLMQAWAEDLRKIAAALRARGAVPSGLKVVDRGFRWDGERQEHVPSLLIEFEPVPANGPCNAKGWKDRDAVAAMLSAATAQPPAALPGEEP